MSNPLNNLENQGENYINISGSVPALDLLARYATVQYKSDTTNFTLNNLNNSIDNILDNHFFGNVDSSLNTLTDIANLLESSHVFNKSLFYNENRQVAVGDISHNASVILDISGTDAITLPIGTTAQRPSSSNLATGQIRYNTTLNVFEGYNGNNWEILNKNSINDLSDVSFNSLALSNNNALLWNSTNNRWESGTISVSGTQTNIDETTDISVNKLDVYSELKVDTINEKTNSSGVTIDGVLLKDGDISGNDASFNNVKLGNNDLQTMINDLQTSKQNILTAGNNITIIGNTISSVGGLADLSKSLINDLSNVSIDNIQTDQYIKWDGEKFVPTTLPSGQTTLTQGQILDSIVGYPGQSDISSATGVYNLADNSTLSFSSNFYTIPTTYTALPSSYIQYKAPTGTKRIMIEIVNNFNYKDVDAMFYAKLYINGTAIDDSELRIRAGRYNIHFYPMFFIITDSIINSLSGNPLITDTNTYQVYVKSFSTNHEVKIPEPGSTQDDSKALFKLTSFGESQGVDVNLGSISLNDLSDVSFNSLALSNNNALLWNSTNNRWEPGTISVSGTQTNIDETTDISLNNLDVYGELKVDTINEKTDSSGVTIESVLLKDDQITAHTIRATNYAMDGGATFVSASRQANFTDLEIKHGTNNNVTFLVNGETGDLSMNGTLRVDTISNPSGISVENVLLQNENITAHTIRATNYAMDGGATFVSASRQANFTDLELKDSNNNVTLLAFGSTGNVSISGILNVDTINEKTNSSGVTIENILLKDGDISGNDASFNNIKLGNNDLQTMINDLQTSKQNTLTAGNNITIIENTISSTGGGQWTTVNTNEIYYSSGNVGIGIVDPDAPLHVKKTVQLPYGPSIIVDGPSHSFISFYENGTATGYTGKLHSSQKDMYLMSASTSNDVLLQHLGGNVGIGTQSPSQKLHVNGTIQCTSLSQSSDNRIKNNIVDISDNQSLTLLRNIPCRYYEYIDKQNMGNQHTIGFIAQEVKERLPIAVKIFENEIPDEYREININNIEILFFDMSNNIHPNQILDNKGNKTLKEKYKITINDLSNTDMSQHFVFYMDTQHKTRNECTPFQDSKSFLFESLPNYLFLYGRVVNDFHTLDKHKLYAINFSATQEIDRIQQQEQTKLEEARNKIITLENELASVKSELAKIKQHLGL